MSALRVRIQLGAEPQIGILAMVLYSAAAHVVFLGLIFLGPHFLPQRPRPPLILVGQIVSPPPAAVAGPPAAPRTAPAAPAAKPQPPPAPKRQPESVPPEPGKPRAKATPEAKSPPKPEPPSRPAATEAPSAAAGAVPQGVGLAGGGGDASGVPSITSTVFPYDWYRTTMVNLIRARWRRPVTPGLTAPLRCSLSFLIARNGSVSEVALAAGSGFSPLDESALRAVTEAGPLPPLPYQYTSESVRAELVFELTPD